MRRAWITRMWLLVTDFVLFECLFYVVYLWRFRSGLFVNPVLFEPGELLLPSIIVSAYWIILLLWFGLYRFDPLQSRLLTARRALDAAGIGILFLFIITFDPGRPLPASRVVLIAYGIGVCLIVGGNRVLLLTILRALRVRGIAAMRTLLVGEGSFAGILLGHLSRHPELGLRIVGRTGRPHQDSEVLGSVPHLGAHSRLPQLLRTRRFDAVAMTLGADQEVTMFRIVRLLQPHRVRVFVPADQYSPLIGQVRPKPVHGHPLVDIRPELMSVAERLLKRGTDVVVSTLLILLTLPLWLVIALAIILDSKGPVFYTQTRVGWRGRPFVLYKFRSMVVNAEARTGAVLAVAGDPRVTRVGRVLRPLRLDELPQLINVLMGQMSLVGPRPERVEFVERFIREIPLYARRLNVKPGITGWSQVHLKYDSGADQIPIKLKYDFFYIENMSLPLDLKILLMTLFVVLRGEGR